VSLDQLVGTLHYIVWTPHTLLILFKKMNF